MSTIYSSIERESSANASPERLVALVDELTWRLRDLRHQIVMLDHVEPQPEPVPLDSAAAEAAVRLDGIFMDHNPHVRMYVRFELPGECRREGLPPGKCVVVFVEQRSPAIRLRRFHTQLVHHAKQLVGTVL